MLQDGETVHLSGADDAPIDPALMEQPPARLVPRPRAPGKLPRKPQAMKNLAAVPRAKLMTEMTNEEFIQFPILEGDPELADLIVIRAGEDGVVSYRVFGFAGSSPLKPIMAAAAHMAGSTADELLTMAGRLNAIVGAINGGTEPKG